MDFKDLFSFWKQGSKKKQLAVKAINSVDMQNDAVERTNFGVKKYQDGGTIDQLPNAIGEFGRESSNPIPVNASYGEVTYLSRLRVENTGNAIAFHRLGSCGSKNVCDHPVDCFEIISLDGTFRDKLYFDMYHDGQSSKVPAGYTMLEELDSLTGVPNHVREFPNGIYEAVAKYSRHVFGSNLALPGLRKIITGNESTVKTQKKVGKYQYSIDRPAESKEYLQSWGVAGRHLQSMFSQYNRELADDHTGFNWLRTDIVSPTFDLINFRFKNRVFSVLLDLITPEMVSDMETKDRAHGYGVLCKTVMKSITTQKAKELQIKICKENDLIPCLFPIAVDKMAPLEDGWNLYDTETGDPVIPTEIAGDSPRKISSWELMNWGISIVMDELKKMGNKILSYTDAPGIMPQIWFEDNGRNKCWVQVVVNRPMEIADLSGSGIENYQGYVSGVMICPFSGDILYRSQPATVKYMGMKAIGKQ